MVLKAGGTTPNLILLIIKRDTVMYIVGWKQIITSERIGRLKVIPSYHYNAFIIFGSTLKLNICSNLSSWYLVTQQDIGCLVKCDPVQFFENNNVSHYNIT